MMLNKAVAYGYRNAGFILDRGYFSRENIRYMDKCGYDFVIMVKGMKSLCNDAIRQVQGTFEDKRQCSIRRYQVSGTTLKMPVFYSDEKDRFLHIYYSYGKAAVEREALEGKMLIAFASLIIRNRMYTKLKDAEEEMAEWPSYMNVPDSIRELEKIEMIRQADGVYRLDHAVTATQKTILNAFGIDANYIKKKVKEISDNLNPRVHKVKI